MKKHIMLVALAIGLAANGLAEERKEYPPISLVIPGASSSPVSRDQFIFVVVEGDFISHEKNPIPKDAVVAYVDSTLKAQGALYIGVHIREGAKYGDVIKALAILRQTSAKSIGVRMAELPAGREP